MTLCIFIIIFLCTQHNSRLLVEVGFVSFPTLYAHFTYTATVIIYRPRILKYSNCSTGVDSNSAADRRGHDIVENIIVNRNVFWRSMMSRSVT